MKMLKFFACYVWLGFGFLIAFKIIFSEERTFGNPIPLITMLVMMLGELEYADKIFPETTRIVLRKKIEDIDDNIPTYIGESDDEKHFLQFSGDLTEIAQVSRSKGRLTFLSYRNSPLTLCCLRRSLFHCNHEPSDWPCCD